MTLDFSFNQLSQYGWITLSILTIILGGLVIYILLRRGLDRLSRNQYISTSLAGVLRILIRWAVIVVVLLLSLQQLGVQMTAVWAALSAGVVFIGVGLIAVWSVFSNALCSLLLLVFQPFQIGDRIEIIEATGGTGLRGEVVNLNPIFTYLEEENDDGHGSTVYVPNNIFFQKSIRRWKGIKSERLDVYMFNEKTPEAVQHNGS
jgi:small-conductance mechanosensitive channel